MLYEENFVVDSMNENEKNLGLVKAISPKKRFRDITGYSEIYGTMLYGDVDEPFFIVQGGTLAVGKSGGEIIGGGTAQNAIVISGGTLDVTEGSATVVSVSSGGLFSLSGGGADQTKVQSGGEFKMYSGIAKNTDVANAGVFTVSGGTASNTLIEVDGTMNAVGGIAEGTTISGGTLSVVNATAISTFVDSGVKGGTMNEVGGIAEGITLSGGTQSIVAHATAISTFVDSGVTQGPIALTAVGLVTVGKGGVLKDTEFNYGRLTVEAGGIITGKFRLNSHGIINSISNDAFVEFDLTEVTPNNEVLIDSLANAIASPNYTILVNADQAMGKYNLLQTAQAFPTNKAVTVKVDGAAFTGTLYLYKAIVNGDYTYDLDLAANSSLVLSVFKALDIAGQTRTGLVIPNDGNPVTVHDNGKIVSTTINAKGNVTIGDRGSAENTILNDGGVLNANTGSIVKNTTINGGALNAGNGEVEGVTVNSGSVMFNSTKITGNVNAIGGTLQFTGSVRVNGTISAAAAVDVDFTDAQVEILNTFNIGNATLSASNTAFTFNITDRRSGDVVLVDSFASNIWNNSDLTLVISDDYANKLGQYKLAGNAASFNGSFKVMTNHGAVLSNSFSVGSTLQIDKYVLSLNIDNNNNLVFSVTESRVLPGGTIKPGAIVVGELDAQTISCSYGLSSNYSGKYTISPIVDEGVDGFSEIQSATITVYGNNSTAVATGVIKNGKLKFNGGREYFLLDKAENYSVVVKSTDVTATDGKYRFELSTVKTFDSADYYNGDDTWRTAGNFGTVTQAGQLSWIVNGEKLDTGWVGFGDTVDYRKITFNSAVDLSLKFQCNGDDVSFTIYDADKNAIQTTYVKAGQTIQTKAVALEKGSYYIVANAVNPEKGTDSEYRIAVDESTVFYNRGTYASNADDWDDLKINGANGKVDKVTIGTITSDWQGFENWVGTGDSVDYFEFKLTDAGKLGFNINSNDDIQVTIYELNQTSKGYSLVALETKHAGKGGASATMPGTFLEAGTYYLGISTEYADQGADALYNITLSQPSVLGINQNNNTWDTATALADTSSDVSGWLGNGNAVDYYSFEIENGQGINIEFSDATRAAIENGEIKIVLYDATYAMIDFNMATYAGLQGGSYSVAFASTNAAKYETEYQAKITIA